MREIVNIEYNKDISSIIVSKILNSIEQIFKNKEFVIEKSKNKITIWRK